MLEFGWEVITDSDGHIIGARDMQSVGVLAAPYVGNRTSSGSYRKVGIKCQVYFDPALNRDKVPIQGLHYLVDEKGYPLDVIRNPKRSREQLFTTGTRPHDMAKEIKTENRPRVTI